MLQVQRGYTSLLASKAQRWEAALKALQDAISTLAHFHAALAAMPGAGPQQRTRAWFDNLQSQVSSCLSVPSLPHLRLYTVLGRSSAQPLEPPMSLIMQELQSTHIVHPQICKQPSP